MYRYPATVRGFFKPRRADLARPSRREGRARSTTRGRLRLSAASQGERGAPEKALFFRSSLSASSGKERGAAGLSSRTPACSELRLGSHGAQRARAPSEKPQDHEKPGRTPERFEAGACNKTMSRPSCF